MPAHYTRPCAVYKLNLVRLSVGPEQNYGNGGRRRQKINRESKQPGACVLGPPHVSGYPRVVGQEPPAMALHKGPIFTAFSLQPACGPGGSLRTYGLLQIERQPALKAEGLVAGSESPGLKAFLQPTPVTHPSAPYNQSMGQAHETKHHQNNWTLEPSAIIRSFERR